MGLVPAANTHAYKSFLSTISLIHKPNAALQSSRGRLANQGVGKCVIFVSLIMHADSTPKSLYTHVQTITLLLHSVTVLHAQTSPVRDYSSFYHFADEHVAG